MGRINHTRESLNADSHVANEIKDCSVKAVAAATGVSYDKARAELAKYGRRHRKGASTWLIKNVLREMGFDLEKVDVKAKTVRTVERELTYGTYLIFVRGHVLAMKNAEVLCHSEGRLARILSVSRVKRKKK